MVGQDLGRVCCRLEQKLCGVERCGQHPSRQDWMAALNSGQPCVWGRKCSILFSDGDLKFKVKRCHTSFIKDASRAPVIVSMGT